MVGEYERWEGLICTLDSINCRGKKELNSSPLQAKEKENKKQTKQVNPENLKTVENEQTNRTTTDLVIA